jgi:hypothetical protein
MMPLPPVGTKFPVENAVLAEGMKGWVIRVVPEGYATVLHGRVTGELTKDGQIEVVIIEEAT